MDNKPKSNQRNGGGRTPQPPARTDTNGKPRSRISMPNGEVPVPQGSPSATAITMARMGSTGRQPTLISPNNNSSSPRTVKSTRHGTSDEPATDEDDTRRFAEPPKDEWLRQSEVTLATLEKQVQDAARRTLKQENRCMTMRDSIVGKDERMDTLRETYATLTRALNELDVLSNGDIDSDALEELYNSIPSSERDVTNADTKETRVITHPQQLLLHDFAVGETGASL